MITPPHQYVLKLNDKYIQKFRPQEKSTPQKVRNPLVRIRHSSTTHTHTHIVSKDENNSQKYSAL